MVKKYIRNFTEVLVSIDVCIDEDREVVSFGILLLLEVIFNVFTAIGLGVLFGMVAESIIFLLSFSFVRIYAGGYHCQNEIYCYLLSAILIFIVLLVVSSISRETMLMVSIIFYMMSFLVFLAVVPVETKNKPLDKDERIHYSSKAVFHLFIEFVVMIILFLKDLYVFAFTVSLGYIICTIMVISQIILDKNNNLDI